MYHDGLFLQPNVTLLICLQRLCDHTFCHPMMHLPLFFVDVSVLLMCVVHSYVVRHRAATSVCVYTVCLLRKKVVIKECFDADQALTPAVLVALVCLTFTMAASAHLRLQL